ncbi:hypothetical protein [Microvirga sesbaniae]|uniref:hypothetical protein n=1 Tax=Microvirga sesbaniae TaxID=681392 RepID=UPI0021C82400|nr:hypothetical protein [Microvirga sp. HBU67692]
MPRRKTALTLVGGSGEAPHEPTPESRQIVVLGSLNNLPADRIAALIGIDRSDLERHYRDELAYGTDRVLIEAASNMLFLAHQRADLGVSLRANQAVLGTRVRSWREPMTDALPSASQIDDMDLATLNDEIARLERRMQAAGEE